MSIEPVTLKTEDLPIHCPNTHSPAWSSHPRVFLAPNKDGKAICPYCSAVYQLAPGEKVHGH